MFSAKGALSRCSLGQRLRIRVNPDAPALKARFTSGTRLLRKHGVDFDERYVWGLKRTDAIDSRLQRLFF